MFKVEVELLPAAPEDVDSGEVLLTEETEAEEQILRSRWMEAITEETEVDAVDLIAAGTELQDPKTVAPMTVRLAQKAINNFTIARFNELHSNLDISSDASNLILPEFVHIQFNDKVGGRVSKAILNWRLITDSEWVLDVVEHGYKLEFASYPTLTSKPIFDELNLPDIQRQAVHDQVLDLVDQGAVRRVSNPYTPRFYSKLFVREKKTDLPHPVFRLIIDLSRLNEHLIVPHFTMESGRSVRNELRQGVYFCKFDLKNAYLHILIHPSSRKYLSFVHEGQVYEWVSLPFGLATSPFVFTKVIAEIGKFVHLRGIHLVQFLDDWLLFCLIFKLTALQKDYILQILWFLGWILNEPKSILDPTQMAEYLGDLYNSLTTMVYNTQDRFQKIHRTVSHFLTLHSAPARHWCQVLGLLTSAQTQTALGRLILRPLQFHLNSLWKGHRNNLWHPIPITQTCRTALSWWLNPQNVCQGVLWVTPPPTIHITSDASLEGFGAHMGELSYQGIWSPQQQTYHINKLEILAIQKCLIHWQDHLKNQSIMIHTDNRSALSYIQHQGGTHSLDLFHISQEIWTLVHSLNSHIQVSHISGCKNTYADLLSRPKLYMATEWSIHPKITQSLFSHWGTPQMDLFASKHNHKLPIYCSLIPDSQALHIDSLSFAWDNIIGYAYPPPRLLPLVLNHIESHSCQIILIAPLWPRAQWYPRLLNLLVDYPLSIPALPHLLKQPKTHQVYHPHPERLHLHAWLLSTNSSLREAFLKKLLRKSYTDTERTLALCMNQSGNPTFIGAIKGVPIHSNPLR